MKHGLRTAILGIGLALGVFAMHGQAATAATMNPGALDQELRESHAGWSIDKVAHKGRRHYRKARRHHRRYVRRHHGHRYRYRRGRHKHYYHGYWYAFPWWLGAPAYGTPYYDPYYDEAPVGSDDEHIAWCEGKYRSYNAETDTYRGYDGYDHRCNSPYN